MGFFFKYLFLLSVGITGKYYLSLSVDNSIGIYYGNGIIAFPVEVGCMVVCRIDNPISFHINVSVPFTFTVLSNTHSRREVVA